jgi:hypothetical protein
LGLKRRNRNRNSAGGGFATALGSFVSSGILRRKRSNKRSSKEQAQPLEELEANDTDAASYFANGSGGDNDTDDDDNDESDPEPDNCVELLEVDAGERMEEAHAVRVDPADPVLAGGSSENGEGSIVLENLKLDMRRLLFGAVPLLKHVSIEYVLL